nr:MAG TPA: hypothetical protein [Caudoviricetes sp.]
MHLTISIIFKLLNNYTILYAKNKKRLTKVNPFFINCIIILLFQHLFCF